MTQGLWDDRVSIATIVWTEADRLEALQSFEVLDVPAAGSYETLVRKAAELLGTHSAAIFLVDRDRQWMMAGVGTILTSMPRAWSICEHSFYAPSPLVVNDTFDDPRFSANPLVTGAPPWRFYAGATIRTREGIPLGGFCVFDPLPRSDPLASGHALLLRTMADRVGFLLEVDRLERLERHLVQHEGADPVTLGRGAWWWRTYYGDSEPEAGQPRNEAPTETPSPLTPQQARVLCWAAHGKSAPEIAIILGLTPRTVRFHLTGASARLGAARTNQAIAIALSRRLIPSPESAACQS